MGKTVAPDVGGKEWVRQPGRTFRPLGDVCFLCHFKSLDCIKRESGMIYFI